MQIDTKRALLTALMTSRASKQELADQIYRQQESERATFVEAFNQCMSAAVVPAMRAAQRRLRELGVRSYVSHQFGLYAPPFRKSAAAQFGLGASPQPDGEGPLGMLHYVEFKADTISRTMEIVHVRPSLDFISVRAEGEIIDLSEFTEAHVARHVAVLIAHYGIQLDW